MSHFTDLGRKWIILAPNGTNLAVRSGQGFLWLAASSGQGFLGLAVRWGHGFACDVGC